MKNILFVGQCKQGSNSLHKLICDQPGFNPGYDIRAMVRSHTENQNYFANWSKSEIESSKWLVDKSIINPDKYDYHIGDWQNYNHKMIFMFRNIYKVLKSQFLVVLAGEESYEHNISKFGKKWDIDNFDENTVIEIMNHNKHKYMNYHNLINLPKDVFDKNKNMFFCTFEDFLDDTNNQFDKLESFLDIKLNSKVYPKLNSTKFEWYAKQTKTYEQNVKLFEKYKDFIYNKYIDKTEYEKISEYIDIDLISKYTIK